jgi:hypothetical protein
MGVLHGASWFQLTPDYDAAMIEHANLHPTHPDPRFDAIERSQLVFHWPDSDPRPRKSNGQFARKDARVAVARNSARNGHRPVDGADRVGDAGPAAGVPGARA